MGDRDPENVKELMRQLLPFSRTPQVLDKLLDYSRTTKLNDIPDTPEFIKDSGLGVLTVGDLIDLLGKVPIYYPNTPLSSYVKETLKKGAVATWNYCTLLELDLVSAVKICQRPQTVPIQLGIYCECALFRLQL